MKKIPSNGSFNFSDWLIDMMEKTNVSSKQLANDTGMSYVAIRFYVTEDRNPSLNTFLMFLDYFGKRMEIVDKQEGI